MALVAALAAGCGTLNTARPLAPGQHAVGASVGGPLVQLFGLPIPMPLASIEGRSGLSRVAGHPVDVTYGLHLTGLLFGAPGVHLGSSALLVRQRGALPALSLGGRLYLFSNLLDGRKAEDLRRFWSAGQVEATLSYELFDQLLYGGAVEYLDLGLPGLVLAPLLGVELHPGLDWLGVQLEARYLVPWKSNLPATPEWIAPFDQGAVLLSVGLVLRLDHLLDDGGTP